MSGDLDLSDEESTLRWSVIILRWKLLYTVVNVNGRGWLFIPKPQKQRIFLFTAKRLWPKHKRKNNRLSTTLIIVVFISSLIFFILFLKSTEKGKGFQLQKISPSLGVAIINVIFFKKKNLVRFFCYEKKSAHDGFILFLTVYIRCLERAVNLEHCFYDLMYFFRNALR